MRAGPLHHRITIQRATVVRDGRSRTEEWDDVVTVWAGITQQAGREYVAAAALQASRRVVFRIRYRDGLTPANRVRHAGSIYNIVDVREIGRREGVELHAVADAGTSIAG